MGRNELSKNKFQLLRLVVRMDIHELKPLLRILLAEADRFRAVERLERLEPNNVFPEQLAAIQRRVAQLNYHVRNRRKVDPIRRVRHAEAPTGHGPRSFERQIALVAEVEFKKAGIVDSAGQGNFLVNPPVRSQDFRAWRY